MPPRSHYSCRSSAHQLHGSKYRVRSAKYQPPSTKQVQPARLRPTTASEAVRIDGRHDSLVPRPLPTLLTHCLGPSSKIEPSWLQDLPSKGPTYSLQGPTYHLTVPENSLQGSKHSLRIENYSLQGSQHSLHGSKYFLHAAKAADTVFEPHSSHI